MCEFIDYLGWFTLTPIEQWEMVLKILTSSGLIFAAWWTVSRWYIARKIETETELIKSLSTTFVAWSRERVRSRNSGNEEEIETADNYLDEIALIRKQVIKGNMSLKKLRLLNRYHLSKAVVTHEYFGPKS